MTSRSDRQTNDAADRLLGEVVDGYLVTDVLGEGGFGRVYRAVALDDGQPVALKLAGGDPMHAERLLREARALGRIDHPRVVRLVGNGYVGDAPYLVLELLDGHRSLTDLIDARAERGEGFGQGEVRAILEQLLDGLEAAHAAGVVHRDVKPDNVMIAGEGRALEVKLLDFGLAKLRPLRTTETRAKVKTPTRRTLALGTPTHMAPEQLEGRGLGPWTDLWAVGVIAFELLTGALPFQGESVSALIRQRTDPDHDPLALATYLSGPCQRLLRRALDPDPQRRFRSVAEMRASVAEALTATPGPAPLPPLRPEVPPPPPPRAGSSRALWPLGLAALLGLGALALTRGGGDA
ncbi:MAG: serine/threonine protein kinase, partial [Deltaproteobacteria bacterium]|nr:serine/threonine protein kinase [Deltaproteobacteria bacterium]